MFLFDKGGLPYLLLDVAALLSLAATSKLFLDSGYSPFAPACDAAAGQECPLFQVGDEVEVHDTPLGHPFAAAVSHVARDEEGAIKYDLRSLLDGQHFDNLPSASVAPKEKWAFGTHGLCDLGESLGERMGRCTVHATTGEDKYLVSMRVDGYLCYHKLLPARLRRIANATALDGVPPQALDFTQGIDDEDEPHLRLGTLVELHTRDHQFAYPAKIVSYVKDGIRGSEHAKYDLEHAVTGALIPLVHPEFVHPYQVLEYGTAAFCNVATGLDERRRKRVSMAPCTVLSSTEVPDGHAYRVSYLNRESMWVQETMPHSRIQRILSSSRI